MIKVYYLNIEKLDTSTFEKGFCQIPSKMKNTLLKFKFEKDRMRGLMGKLILKKLLIEMGYSINALEQVKLDQYNRPYLNRVVDFNIAHSGDYVICGISKQTRIGVDIEQIQNVDFDNYDIIFSDIEKIELRNHGLCQTKFYSIWSKKEAVAKADGRGLGIPLPKIEIEEENAKIENEEWLLKEIEVNPNYKAHIAYKGMKKIEIMEICCYALINNI